MGLGTTTGGAHPFVGRDEQLALLDQVFASAAAGRPAVVLVQGDAGMGKSALIAQAAARFEAAGAVLLCAAGDEAESALPLGVVGQLGSGIAPLPGGMTAGGGPAGLDPLAAGAGLLQLLGELQDRGPVVVVVVDDAHWADSASLHALAFCLRRLRADRVLAMLAARTEEAHRLPRGLTALAQHPAGTTLSLPGLTKGEIAELARALGAGVLSRRTAGRLACHTGGSPLLVGALLADLGVARLSVPEGLEAHAPRSYSSMVLARLAGCPARGRELVMAGSVLGTRWPLALAAELAGADDALAAADEAAAAGLIVIEHRPGEMPLGVFSHPLARAALYQELTLTRRAGLHRAAAALTDQPRDALRHRVEAEIGPNPSLAAELDAAARRDAADGWWATAARTHLWAARVAPGRAEREAHVLDAAVLLLLAGDVAESRALVDQAATFAGTARLHVARGYLALADGAFGSAEASLRAAWGAADGPRESELAARAAYLLSSLYVYRGRGAEGMAWARRAVHAHPGPLPGASPRTVLLLGYGISGQVADGLAEAARLQLDTGQVDARQADGLVGRGALRLLADDPAGARRDLLPVAEACLRHGPLEAGMYAGVHLADAEWRLGLWDDALLHAEAAVNAAAETLHGWFAAEAHVAVARPLIVRGEWQAAEAQVREAVGEARRVGYGHGSLSAVVARALLADARGNPQRVVATLTPLLRFTAADGVDHPGVYPWRELLGAALVTVGESGQAREHAAALEDQAQRLGLRSARARALRLRGLIDTAAGLHQAAIGFLELRSPNSSRCRSRSIGQWPRPTWTPACAGPATGPPPPYGCAGPKRPSPGSAPHPTCSASGMN